MLFSLVVAAVFFLPYHFLIQVDSQSRNVTENFQGLLDAVAHNENETIAKFVGELRKSERRLEEAFDTLNDEIQSSLSHHHREHRRHQIISAERNVTTKRETDIKLFDRVKALEKLDEDMEGRDPADQIRRLKKKVVDEQEEKFNLGQHIGQIREQKNAARELEITLTPRLLIDTIEGRFDDDFKAAKDTMPADLEKAGGALIKAKSTIEKMKQLLQADPNNEEYLKKQDSNTRLIPLLEKNITEFKFYLDNIPSDPTQERIERRKRKWHWFLHHKSQDGEIKKLLDRIEVDYIKQLESESPVAHSKEEFMDKFCYALARAHEEGSVIVHAIKKIEADDEFEIIHFFYDDDLDPYLTTLVNAIGLRKRKPGPRFVVKKKKD